MDPLFETVLVANRGEIAARVIRTLRWMGIRSAAVYAPDDVGAPHVRLADVAVPLGDAAHATASQTYLNIDAVLQACRATGATAVHPGYGFLSENVEFARALEAAGMAFIGPPVDAINLMGDKIRAKNHVAGFGVPVVPGVAQPGLSDAELTAAAAEVGLPLLIKPSAGGGGKGMVAVHSMDELPDALSSARRTASGAFGDDTLLLERLVTSPRHIEVQVLADAHGATVHLGERECSLQRRHQKVIEEAPAPLLLGLGAEGERIRAELGAAAVRAAQSVGYVGAGTVEFLVSDDAPGEFFFMEMNTRLQVEHPVTEEVARVGGERLDLVEQQVRIAAGERLSFRQEDVALIGHAVEARVYAEDPGNGFLPSSGEAFLVEFPSGDGVRVDAALEGSGVVSGNFDPMIAKVIASGTDRDQALERCDAALAGTVVLGVQTNLEYLRSLLADEEVIAGRLDTTLIERRGAFAARELTAGELRFAADGLERLAAEDDGGANPGARVGGGAITGDARRAGGPWQAADGWRLGEHVASVRYLDVDGEVVRVPEESGESVPEARLATRPSGEHGDAETWMMAGGRSARVRLIDRREVLRRRLAAHIREETGGDPQVVAPMPGAVVVLDVADGDLVAAGARIGAVEAMKMEHPLHAAISGRVTLTVSLGEQVRKDQAVAIIHPVAPDDSTTTGEPAHNGEGAEDAEL